MQIPENVWVINPCTVDEALIQLAKNPGSICLHAFSDHIETKYYTADIHYVINLSGIDELGFFMEDHAWWFIGSALNPEELSEIALDRIPELGSLLLQHRAVPEESLIQWLQSHKARLHIAGKNGMNIRDFNTADQEIISALLGKHGIPCMISIPKSDI